MPEQDKFTFHDPRYARVGELVIQAANDASSRLQKLEGELTNSSLHGSPEGQALEERKTKLEQDAALWGRMAVCLDPDFQSAGNGSVTRMPVPSTASSAGSPQELTKLEFGGSGNSSADRDEDVQRIKHKNAARRELYNERLYNFVEVMVGFGNEIEREGSASPGVIIRDGMGMEQKDWSIFGARLQRDGILVYEKDPVTKSNLSAYMDTSRLEELVRVGDLPELIADELTKLEDQDGAASKPAISRDMAGALSNIHTRYSGASTHSRAERSR